MNRTGQRYIVLHKRIFNEGHLKTNLRLNPNNRAIRCFVQNNAKGKPSQFIQAYRVNESHEMVKDGQPEEFNHRLRMPADGHLLRAQFSQRALDPNYQFQKEAALIDRTQRHDAGVFVWHFDTHIGMTRHGRFNTQTFC